MSLIDTAIGCYHHERYRAADIRRGNRPDWRVDRNRWKSSWYSAWHRLAWGTSLDTNHWLDHGHRLFNRDGTPFDNIKTKRIDLFSTYLDRRVSGVDRRIDSWHKPSSLEWSASVVFRECGSDPSDEWQSCYQQNPREPINPMTCHSGMMNNGLTCMS